MGCPLKAFGISARILKAIPNYPYAPYTGFYVRVSAGGTGALQGSFFGDRKLTVGYSGSANGAAFNGARLKITQDPPSTCPTIFGSSICLLPDTIGAVLTVTPGVTDIYYSSGGVPQGDANIGPSTSITLNPADTAVIDTGMLGPSYCDVRPSTQRGDPINISSGNVYRNEVDAVINSGKIGAFSFERNYNSLNGEISRFGYGWQDNFDIRILSGPVLQEGSGRRTRFYYCSTTGLPNFPVSHYCAPPGVTDSLVHVEGVFAAYYLYKRDGTGYSFSVPHDSLNDRIKSIIDRNNNSIEFIYNASHRLDTVREAGGRAYNFVYTGTRIDTLKNQAGTTLAAYTYYSGADTNYLKKVTYGDGSWVEYTYEPSGNPKKLIKVLTSDNNEYSYEYDSKGRAKASYRTGNVERIDVTYERRVGTGSNADSLLAVVTDSLGNRDTLITQPNALATDRLLIKGRNAGCSACADSFKYDDHSNLIYKRSRLGVVDTMAYDIADRLLLRVEAKRVDGVPSFARTDSFHYHSNFDLVDTIFTKSIVDSSKFSLRVSRYDANGNLLKAIDSGLITTTTGFKDSTIFTYNSSGQVLTIDGPRSGINDMTRFTYKATTGDLDSVIEYTGTDSLKTAYISYDAFGNPLTVAGPNSDTTIYEYNERQRVKKITRRKGSSVDGTLYGYNFAGDIKQITLPLGNTIIYGYDPAGRLTSIVNSMGDSILYTYDLMSNRKSERVRKGATLFKTTYYDYDSRSRLTQVCVGDSVDTAKYDCTKFGYDEVGNRRAQLSARGDSTYFRYDALNRLDTVIQKHDGGYDTTVYTYDLQDNLTSVRIYQAPDSTITTYKYSDRGHLIEENSPASGTTTYKYDPAGNLITKIPATGNADSVSYVYDALNRQNQIKLGGVSTYTFDYDSSTTDNRKGRLWKETGPLATRKFSYDYTGRVTAESVVASGATYPVLYVWNANGNLTKLTYPSTREVNYTYDLADRVNKVTAKMGTTTTTILDSVFYFPFGPDTSMKLGNGIKMRRKFDRRYYADSIKSTTAGIFGRSYRYDHNGNINGLVDLIDNTKSYDTLKYDGVDRLLNAIGNNRTDDLIYTYFKNGNRKSKKKGADSTTYNYTNNRLTSTTGAEAVTYGFNNNGSVTLAGSPTYIYDKLNRIVKITGIAPTDSFAYDAENKRVYKNEQGVVRNNIYDIYGNLIEETNLGPWAIDYIWANGEPRARVDNPETEGFAPLVPTTEAYWWYHTDHLGTPYVLTDKNKAIVWKISLDPFGETVTETSPLTLDNLRFPGQYFDRGSGLNYNWHRYYQPKIGRYYQTDPYWGFRFGGTYNYAENNPTVYIDPLGLFGIRDFIRHYYSKDPGPIDLGTVGLLEEFKNTRSVQQATSTFANIVGTATATLAKDICGNCGKGVIFKAYQVDWVTRTKVTWASTALFSVGKSSFFSTSTCNMIVNCSSKQYSYSCINNFSIQDAFKQPLTFIGYRGEIGGTPYPINASWSVRFSDKRSFK